MTKKLFTKGNIIVTTPEEGYYGVAIVLDDAIPLELSPGRFSYPMNHILITPLLFTKPVSMDDINIQDLKPLVFTQYFNNNGGLIFWRNKICIYIYTNRNKANLTVIGDIDTTLIGDVPPLSWESMDDRFHLCGDVKSDLGREAYIQYCRINNIDL
ncbi:MAG: hypothetical protein IIW82_07745 [Clostridia bacterium]|nr:hypothetical protein [Clostridia bacterium]